MPALPYNGAIPTAGQRLRDSQPQMLENFGSLQTYLETNHVAFADGDPGKHKYVSMPEQVAAPATAANEMALYTKVDGGVSELFVRRESSGNEIQITDTVTAPVNSMTLPNGIIMKWGETAATAILPDAWTTVNFAVAFPTACLSVVISPVRDSAPPASAGTREILTLYSVYTAAAFQVYNRRPDGTSLATGCSFFAIGY